MEKLICNCGNDKKHHHYVDENKEIILECRECYAFLKFPAGSINLDELKTSESGTEIKSKPAKKASVKKKKTD